MREETWTRASSERRCVSASTPACSSSMALTVPACASSIALVAVAAALAASSATRSPSAICMQG